MLEVLLSRGTGIFIPNSGPGPKTLQKGNKEYGYFGTVTEAQLGLNAELSRLLNTMSDTQTERNLGVTPVVWFKFIIKQKILFIPKVNLANGVRIADLYKLRAVFDHRETYKPTVDYTTGQALYTQTRMVRTGNDLFMLRLMDAMPLASGNTVANQAAFVGSEVAMTLNALINNNGGVADTTLDIRKFSSLEFRKTNLTSAGEYSYVKEYSASGTIGTHVWTSSNGQLARGNDGGYGWRPVLELIPESEAVDVVLTLEDYAISNSGLPTASTITTADANVANVKALKFFTDEVPVKGTNPSGESSNYLRISSTESFQTSNNFGTALWIDSQDGFALYATSLVATSETQATVDIASEAIAALYDTSLVTTTNMSATLSVTN